MTMNGSFTSKTNIKGETSVVDDGYSPTFENDQYYANPDDSIYEWIIDKAMNRLSGDQAKASFLEVIVEDTSDTNHVAWMEDCVIEIKSYGGDTTGMAVPFTVHPRGNRKKGKVTIASTTGVVTFTAD